MRSSISPETSRRLLKRPSKRETPSQQVYRLMRFPKEIFHGLDPLIPNITIQYKIQQQTKSSEAESGAEQRQARRKREREGRRSGGGRDAVSFGGKREKPSDQGAGETGDCVVCGCVDQVKERGRKKRWWWWWKGGEGRGDGLDKASRFTQKQKCDYVCGVQRNETQCRCRH